MRNKTILFTIVCLFLVGSTVFAQTVDKYFFTNKRPYLYGFYSLDELEQLLSKKEFDLIKKNLDKIPKVKFDTRAGMYLIRRGVKLPDIAINMMRGANEVASGKVNIFPLYRALEGMPMDLKTLIEKMNNDLEGVFNRYGGEYSNKFGVKWPDNPVGALNVEREKKINALIEVYYRYNKLGLEDGLDKHGLKLEFNGIHQAGPRDIILIDKTGNRMSLRDFVKADFPVEFIPTKLTMTKYTTPPSLKDRMNTRKGLINIFPNRETNPPFAGLFSKYFKKPTSGLARSAGRLFSRIGGFCMIPIFDIATENYATRLGLERHLKQIQDDERYIDEVAIPYLQSRLQELEPIEDCCPENEEEINYIKEQLAKINSCRPQVIQVEEGIEELLEGMLEEDTSFYSATQKARKAIEGVGLPSLNR